MHESSSSSLVNVKERATTSVIKGENVLLEVMAPSPTSSSVDDGQCPAQFTVATTKTSQPKTTNEVASTSYHRHFLQGVEIDTCADILSIPDPPSPSSDNDNMKKSSKAVVFASPLRDVSNADEAPSSTTQTQTSQKRSSPSSLVSSSSPSSTTSTTTPHNNMKRVRWTPTSTVQTSPLVSQKKRLQRRRRLCGYLEQAEQQQEEEASSLSPSSSSLPNHEDEVQGTEFIQHDEENGEEESSSMSSRRKQGASTFVTVKVAPTLPPPPSFTPSPPPPQKQVAMYRIPNQPDTQGLQEIRKLVHAYTLLPEDERFESQPVKDIERLSGGYQLVPAYLADGRVSEADKLQRRQHIFANLTSRMEGIDDCKRRDVQLTEEATQCTAQKLRGGYVEYTHIPTGRKVPPQEFEARYMCMIDEVTSIRSNAWGAYFAKLGQELQTSSSLSSSSSSSSSSSEDTSSTPSDTDNNNTQEGYSSVDQSVTVEEEELPSQLETNLDLIETPAAAAEVVDQEDDQICPHVIYKNIKCTSQTKSASLELQKDLTTPTKVERRPLSPTSPDMLLPFPSRDKPSEDVLIARAEAKLWNTIDTALEVYSKEVLEIQATAIRKANM
jgi:hypothetical protein